jgi:hypothetical protein
MRDSAWSRPERLTIFSSLLHRARCTPGIVGATCSGTRGSGSTHDSDWAVMRYPIKGKLRYEDIENGALILLLLRESVAWEELCGRFDYVDPTDANNTATMALIDNLRELRDLGLIRFEDSDGAEPSVPTSEITTTRLWSTIRAAFGGMSISDAALLSRQSTGMAVVPAFGRPRRPKESINVFVLMPFNEELEGVYRNHIRPLCDELGVSIRRADDIVGAGPFMEKVWDGICAADPIIADCTQRNPNVFYEIGMAHTIGTTVVLLTRSEDDIPADIKHYEYIPYVYDPEGVGGLIDKLRIFIKSHFDL